VDLDFTRLYKKSRWLRALEPLVKNPAGKGGMNAKGDTAIKKGWKQPEEKPLPRLSGLATVLGRILTSVKHITLSYSENSSSTIYGYMDSTQWMGMDLHSKEPGWGYIFGQQPDTNFINRLGKKGLLSTDTSFNSQNQLTFTQKFSLSAMVQPIPGLDIQFSLDKSFGQNYSELYKDTAGGAGLSRLNPYSTGTFSVSFISFQTLFEKFSPTAISGTFQQFENNRAVISNRLGNENPYSAGLTGTDGYAAGYGKYSQDVLIPAFIAAYTHKDPYKIALINEGGSGVRSNPFSGYIPKPNWHLTYSGLSKLPFFDKLFTSFIITNAYTGLLSMGSFNSNTNYKDPMGYGQAGFIDTLTGNFVPYFQVPNITMTEQFSPLIDVDMQFRNQASVKIGYSKSRQLSLSLTDYQMTEARSSELTIGAGWKKKGLRLPFNITLPGKGGGGSSGSNVQGKGSTGKGGAGNGSSPTNQGNDVTFRLDVSIRDDISTNTYLDQTSSTPTAGQRIIRVAPSVDVVLNKRISCKLYFDRSHTIPRLSSSYPTTTTKAGIQIQISLSP
jgi:cell surface protein SprA